MKKFIILMVMFAVSMIVPAKTQAEEHYQITVYKNVELVTKTSTQFWGDEKVSYGLRHKGIQICKIGYEKAVYVPELKLIILNNWKGWHEGLKVFNIETGECLYDFDGWALISDMIREPNKLYVKFGSPSLNIWQEETFVRKDNKTSLVSQNR